MLILDEAYQPVRRLAPVLLGSRERAEAGTVLRLLGRLVAYVPATECAYYAWLLSIAYRPARRLSERQFSPPFLRVCLSGRYELGIVLGHWLLGMELGQPLVWCRRTADVSVSATR